MNEQIRALSENGPIVFYDGECGLCDRFVKFLIRRDRHTRLQYSALQGSTAEVAFGPAQSEKDLWSVRLVDATGVYDRSDAALRTLAHVGGIWKGALALLIVPRFIRDGVYRFVATNRYRWFGKREACLLPTASLRERFLP